MAKKKAPPPKKPQPLSKRKPLKPAKKVKPKMPTLGGGLMGLGGTGAQGMMP